MQESYRSKLVLAFEIDGPKDPLLIRLDESNQGRKHRQNCTLGPKELPLCVNSTESAVEKGLAMLEEGGLLKIEHRNGGLQTTLLSGGKINRKRETV